MKLNKENYELIMFDLLEGNLPETERENIIKQIDTNEFYKSEWALFQSTVLLKEETLTYVHKERLFKKEARIIPLRSWLNIAVAACFIVAIFIFIARDNTTHPVVNSVPEHSENPSSKPTSSNLLDSSNGIPAAMPEKNSVHNKPEVVVGQTENTVDAENPIEDIAEEKPILFVNQIEDVLEPKLLAADFSDSSKLLQPLIANNEPIEEYLNHNVTSSSLSRISSKVVHSLYMVSNPRMRIDPNWKERNFKIELETTGYYASANINPFNTKK